jgi:hypothetical protein
MLGFDWDELVNVYFFGRRGGQHFTLWARSTRSLRRRSTPAMGRNFTLGLGGKQLFATRATKLSFAGMIAIDLNQPADCI